MLLLLILLSLLAEDHNAVEKRRSVTMDSPEIAKDADKSEDDKTQKGRSKTVGDIEGSATSPVKVLSCTYEYMYDALITYIHSYIHKLFTGSHYDT